MASTRTLRWAAVASAAALLMGACASPERQAEAASVTASSPGTVAASPSQSMASQVAAPVAAALDAGSLELVTDATFATKVRDSADPYVLLFTSTWCEGLCRRQQENMEAARSEFEPASVHFGIIDVDASPRTQGKYSVNSLPTTLLFRQGQVQATLIGNTTTAKLRSWLLQYL